MSRIQRHAPKAAQQSLERALKTIDAEVSERAGELEEDDYEGIDSVRELLMRLGRAQAMDS